MVNTAQINIAKHELHCSYGQKMR